MLSSNHICHINIFSYFPKRGFKENFPLTYPYISLFFPLGLKEFLLYLNTQIGLSLDFPRRFLEEFFHIKIKQGLITRPQEEHIDYKTSRRTN